MPVLLDAAPLTFLVACWASSSRLLSRAWMLWHRTTVMLARVPCTTCTTQSHGAGAASLACRLHTHMACCKGNHPSVGVSVNPPVAVQLLLGGRLRVTTCMLYVAHDATQGLAVAASHLLAWAVDELHRPSSAKSIGGVTVHHTLSALGCCHSSNMTQLHMQTRNRTVCFGLCGDAMQPARELWCWRPSYNGDWRAMRVHGQAKQLVIA